MPNARSLAEERQFDLEAAIRRIVEVDRTRLRTALPAVVDAYDAAAQTATVTPQIRSQWRDEAGVLQESDMPALQGVPVYFPRAGGFAVTVPVTAGDPCLLLFADRNIAGYLESGVRQAPPTGRKHAYQDAIVLPGLAPSGDALAPAPSSDSVEIRSDDASTVVRIGPAGVEIESAGVFSATSTGAVTLTRGASELLSVISTALDAIATSTAGGAPLSNAAAITAARALIEAMRAP